MKLAIVTTHPIQYNAPWFRLVSQARDFDTKVFYTWEQSNQQQKYDPGFGKIIEWDIPLLEGYDYTFVKNTSEDPGSHHYKGIVNPTLNKEIEEWGASAVLIFGWPFKSHFGCMRYFKGKIPVLFRGDSTLLDEKPGIKQFIRRLFLKYVYKHIDYALYVGTNNKKYFIAHGLAERQLIFTPHAIDNSRFEHGEQYHAQALQWRNSLGINDTDFVVLFAGKFIEKKNPMFIIRMAERIQGENIRFLMVGNGALEEDLKKASKDNRIVFAGFQNQSQMAIVYHACNVFVLPSKGPGETWGLAINEAMACNKPVIANNKVGAAIDLIKNGVNGIIIEDGDIDSAVAYIDKLRLDAGIYDTITKVNKQLLDVYCFNSIVQSIVSLMNTIKERGRA